MTDPTKLRFGILGAARVNERLMPAIVEAANAELVAIASRRPGAAAETLAKYAPGYPGVKTYDQLDALLDDPNVDAVYLPLANHEHGEWAVRAIERGKHVLCEKPMALSLAEIDAIEAAVARHGVTVMEGFMYRFHPQHQRVRELIDSGLIGEVRAVRTEYSFLMRPARMYRLAESVERGGGAMWDIGPYAIHSARQWFDRPAIAVTAIAKFVDSGADITTSGVLDFGEGRHAHFDVSFECGRRSEYVVMGTRGGVRPGHSNRDVRGDRRAAAHRGRAVRRVGTTRVAEPQRLVAGRPRVGDLQRHRPRLHAGRRLPGTRRRPPRRRPARGAAVAGRRLALVRRRHRQPIGASDREVHPAGSSQPRTAAEREAGGRGRELPSWCARGSVGSRP